MIELTIITCCAVTVSTKSAAEHVSLTSRNQAKKARKARFCEEAALVPQTKERHRLPTCGSQLFRESHIGYFAQ